ncbi:hypothetical protein [Lentimicrobium sp. S6]|uniref:hypothetical protein n=1 Tax=Lentimicrobium sp. S6 TaxID=2735872 RepID=UPI0015517488|nr:hypothetical protein [Lentimicrobium sp. S6]NPD45813.1 hypothetical protein [Lentimicrobium sp. S6]
MQKYEKIGLVNLWKWRPFENKLDSGFNYSPDALIEKLYIKKEPEKVVSGSFELCVLCVVVKGNELLVM